MTPSGLLRPPSPTSSTGGGPSLARSPHRSWSWAAVIVSVLVLAGSDPERLGLQASGGGNTGWWLFLGLLYLPGLGALATSASVRRGLLGWPVCLLVASFVWTALVAPFGNAGPPDVAYALGMLSVAVVGVWMIVGFGWDRSRQVVADGLLIFLSASVVAQLSLESTGRWQGLAVHSNRLAPMAAVALPIALATRRSNRFAIPLAAIGALTLWMTDSRTSMAAAAGALIIMLGAAIGRRLFPVVLVMAMAGLVVLQATQSIDSVFEAAARSGESEEISGLNGRTEAWQLAVDQIGADPVTGVGAASTNSIFDEAFAEGQIEWGASHPHNGFLQAAMNGGLPAAVLFAASILAYGLPSGSRRRPERDAVVFIIFVVSVTEDLLSFPNSTVLLLAACLSSLAVDRSTSIASSAVSSSRRWR